LATRDEQDKIESRLANAKIIARLVEIAEQPEQPTTEIDVLTESESPESPVEETVAVDAIDETVASPSAISSSDEPAESATTEE
jgi:hypothetical protein